MRIEIWLGKLPLPVETSGWTLEFDDGVSSVQKQYTLAVLKFDKEGKVVERTEIGIVNKSDITRIAKAT